jgi:anti-sigma B factor antagonist
MEVTASKLKRCTLFQVSGRIDSSTAPQLQSAINEATDEGNYKLVLDMSKVDFISSAGLWVLVNAQKKCKRFNRGEVVLTGLGKRIHDALDLAGFIPYFKILDDPAQAVGSF